MNSSIIKRFTSLFFILLTSVIAARADALTWDPALNGGSGGSGTWNFNTTANWYNGVIDVKWTDNTAAGTNTTIFSGTAGTVTLNSSLSASNLQFTVAGYTLSGSGTLTIGGGGIDASALGSGTTTIGSALNLAGPQQLWQVGSGATLAINGIVNRNTGAAVDFTVPGITSSTLTNVNGVLSAWATVGAANGAASGDWAANDGSGNIIAYTGYTVGTAIATGTATQNWKNTANATVTANTTINSLVQQADVTVSAGATLTLNNGGLVLWGVSRWMLANSTTTSFLKSGASTGELFVHVPSPSSGNNWTLWPVIADAAVPAKLIKDGAGMVKMGNNANTYTGGTIVNGGILGSRNPVTAAGICTPFGTASITVNNAQLQLGTDPTSAFGEYDITNNVTLNNGTIFEWDAFQHVQGGLTVGAYGGTLGATFDNKNDGLNKGFAKGLFIDGLVTGTGGLTVQHSGLNTGNAWNSSAVYFTSLGTAAQNTYSGTITVNSFVNGGSYLYLIGTNALANATINLAGDNSAGTGRFGSPTLLFGSGTNLDGPGFATIGGLAGVGSFVLGNTRVTQAASSIGAAVNLTVGNNNTSSTYSGVMSGAGNLIKTGTGTLTLAGVNTYTGDTVISNGTLALSGGSINNSTNLIIASKATFDVSGNGSITLSGSQTLSSSGTNNGSVNTSSGTRIYAGTDGGYGTNTFNNDLNLASAALLYFDVGTLSNGTNDRVRVVGTLTANNNFIHLKAPSGSVSLQAADYTLITSANPISGSFNATPAWDVAPANAGNFSIVTSGSTVTLHYSANSAPTGTGFATPSTVTRNQKTLLTVLVTNGIPGTVQTVVVDASSIGGSASFSLVRSNLSNVFTNSIAPTAATTAGGKTLPATVTDSVPLNAIVNLALNVMIANDVWNGAAANNFFSSNLNWTNQAAPGFVGDSLQFSGTTRLTPSMDTNYNVTGITFDSTAGSFNLGTANSSVLTLAGGLTNNSVNAQIVNVPMTLSAVQTINAAVGDIALGGVVSGAGSITKTGNGTLALSATGNALDGNVGVLGGALNITGGSTVVGTGLSYAGFRANSGSLNISGGTFTAGGDFGVGYSDLNGTAYNATGTVAVANATVSVGRLIVARGNNNQNTVSGTVTLNSGATVNSEGDVLLGFAGNNNLGKVIINGGTLNVATAITRWLIMGQWDTAQSQLDINSGQVKLNGNSAIRFAINGNTGTNTFNLNGGAVTFYSDNATTIGGGGVLDLHQGNGATVVNTFNLNGGILTVPGITSANVAGTRTFNFNGGTLKATASTSPFMNLGTGNAVANVRNGGALVDDGGFTISIDQALVHSTIAGDNAADGGLIKSGVGSLTLTAANTYNGATMINAGTLALSGSGAIVNSTNINTSSGAIFDVSGITFVLGGSQSLSGNGNVSGSVSTTAGSKIYAGTYGVYGTNTFNNDLELVSGAACYLDLGTIANGSNDQFIVTGSLVANNNVIHLKAPSAAVNLDVTTDYLLITSGGLAGSFASAPVWDVAPANAGHYSIVTSGANVVLHYNAAVTAPTVSASASPSTLLRNQPTRISANVTPGSASISTVTVDLSALGGSTMSLVRSNLSNVYTNTVIVPATMVASVVPLTVTATDNATLTGSAGISLTIVTSTEVWNGGGGNPNWSTNPNWLSAFAPGLSGDGLLFAGTAGLAPNMDANYSITSLTFSNNAGSFILGSSNGSTLTLTGGGLVNNAANAETLNLPVTLTAPQSFNTTSGSLIISGAIADSAGGLTKIGNGNLILSGANTFTGPATVSAGSLTIPAPGVVAPTSLINVSDSTGIKAVLNIAGGTLQANSNPGQFSSSLTIGSSAGAVGDLQLGAGGTLAVLQQFAIGTGSGAYAAFEMSGGTATIGSFMVLGFNNDRSVFTMTNGTLTITNNLLTIGAGGTASIGVASLSGGTFTSTATTGYGPTIGGVFVGEFGTGILNVSRNASVSLSGKGLALGVNGGANGVVNLQGGVVNTTSVSKGGGSGTLNFNGGTLKAGAANGSFVSGLTAAYVYSGGALIDDGSNAVTVAQPLLAPTGYGVYSITVANGGSGYFAPPLIVLTNGTGSGATATAQVNPVTGVVTGIVVDNPGVGYTPGDVISVAIIGGGGSGAVANQPVLVSNTSGGLTKLGGGTLTLSGANTYTGNTAVSAGILELAQPVLATGASVTVASGAALQLDFAVTNRVAGLVLNGVSQAAGVYNNITTPAYLLGTGSLQVGTAIASNPTNITFSVTGNSLTLAWPSDHLGWILQSQTSTLSTGLGTNWVDVPGSVSVTSTNLSLNRALPSVFYRLRHP